MKTASITETKNRLSAILDQVREGESFLIVDRGVAVARLDPVHPSAGDEDSHLADLERRGLIRRGRGRIRRELIETAPPPIPTGLSLLAALLDERREDR